MKNEKWIFLSLSLKHNTKVRVQYVFFNSLDFNIYFHVMLGRCVDVFSPATCSDFKRKGWCETMPVVENNCCLTCGEDEEERGVTGNNNIRFRHPLD
jgi:hypothetical protein